MTEQYKELVIPPDDMSLERRLRKALLGGDYSIKNVCYMRRLCGDLRKDCVEEARSKKKPSVHRNLFLGLCDPPFPVGGVKSALQDGGYRARMSMPTSLREDLIRSISSPRPNLSVVNLFACFKGWHPNYNPLHTVRLQLALCIPERDSPYSNVYYADTNYPGYSYTESLQLTFIHRSRFYTERVKGSIETEGKETIDGERPRIIQRIKGEKFRLMYSFISRVGTV